MLTKPERFQVVIHRQNQKLQVVGIGDDKHHVRLASKFVSH
jgi:hypothetical protein